MLIKLSKFQFRYTFVYFVTTKCTHHFFLSFHSSALNKTNVSIGGPATRRIVQQLGRSRIASRKRRAGANALQVIDFYVNKMFVLFDVFIDCVSQVAFFQNVHQNRTSMNTGMHLYEAAHNAALLAFKLGDYQQSSESVGKALEIYPGHQDSLELKQELRKHFSTL